MPATDDILESIEYRVILIELKSGLVLAVDTFDGSKLPRVCIPKRTRPVQQLQRAILSIWGLHVLILDFVITGDGSTPLAIAELLTPLTSRPDEWIAPSQLSDSELAETERSAFMLLIEDEPKSPLSRIGWFDEAIAWVESVMGQKLSCKNDIEQANAGGAFALARFRAHDGSSCWLKATGDPNRHELSITSLLSRLCRGYLPEFLDSKPEWNAWLMSGEGTGIAELPANPFELFCLLEDAVTSLAQLQLRTVGSESTLRNAGAFDQRIDTLLADSDALFDYLDEVTETSTSWHLSRLGEKRPWEIRIAFQIVCERLQHLGIPETILHGDMNPGNILIGCGHCQFIDWSEAYVGHCLVTLEHLMLPLNNIETPDVQAFMKSSLEQRYASVWANICSPDAFQEGFCYMPLMAAASALYGRGEWLNSPERYDARRTSYARVLATYMDRALRRPDLQEALSALRPAQLCIEAAAYAQ